MDVCECNTRVLVVAAGLGTNAGLGVEVPLSFGKFVSDGFGGVHEITREERHDRYVAGGAAFSGFMGESFSYKWEQDVDYKGNAGFLVGVLLQDRHLSVDIFQHPFGESDQAVVRRNIDAALRETGEAGARRGLEALREALRVEKESMWRMAYAETHSESLSALLKKFDYDVIMVGSKGIRMVLGAIERMPIGQKWSAFVINGAEYHLPEYAYALDGSPPGEEGARFVSHPSIHRLVLSSHGGVVGGKLRKRVVQANGESRARGVVGQHIVVYSALDHRLVPNRETHSLPWSMTFPFECWFPGRGKPPRLVQPDGLTVLREGLRLEQSPMITLLHWAAWGRSGIKHINGEDGTSMLGRIVQFPGPSRFAEIRVEIAKLGCPDVADDDVFEPIQLAQLRDEPSLLAVDAAHHPHSAVPPWEKGSPTGRKSYESDVVFDILFDAQLSGMQVVLKDVQTGAQHFVGEILQAEGQYATRLVRFFRYYTELSASLVAELSAENEWSLAKGQSAAETMLEEILAMNKNSGNFLWTGFMTPYTAFTPLKRFGADLLEVVVEIELARMGGPYLGFFHSKPNAEHVLKGHHSAYGDALDEFFESQLPAMREQRRRAFLSTVDFDAVAARLSEFNRKEDIFFQTHGVSEILGYIRREFTVGDAFRVETVDSQLARSIAQLGLSRAPAYHFSDFGHSTGFRIFPDGKAWLAASCERSDFDFIQRLVARDVRVDSSLESPVLALLTRHRGLMQQPHRRRYWPIPAEMMPPGFFRRNGYQVVGYRKFGDAGRRFNGIRGALENFNVSANAVREAMLPLTFDGFGSASPASYTFGQFDKLPAEIGRGGTTAKLYLYDTEFKKRTDAEAAVVREGVNLNQSSWWELQLYAMLPRDLKFACLAEERSSTVSLTFTSEVHRLRLCLQTQLEQDLAAGGDGGVGSVASTGIREMLGEWLRRVAGAIRTPLEKTVLTKGEVIDCMNFGLRMCQEFGDVYTRQVREAASKSRQRFFSDLRADLPVSTFQESTKSYLEKLLQKVETYNIFTDLQEEVNVILDALESCS